MNYIKHLNGILDQFSKDTRLNPTHISLYIALFQFWNYNRFPDDFYINREEIMSFSKIGSKSTYHRCIKELSHWKYILYSPSHNPFKGSKVKMFNFETSTKTTGSQAMDLDYPISGQALVSNINIYKQDKHVLNIKKTIKKEVLFFFNEKEWPKQEAEKFFNHYESIGWKKGINPIENWKAAAEIWMLNSKEMKRSKSKNKQKFQTDLPLNHFQDNLHVNQNKNYDEPL